MLTPNIPGGVRRQQASDAVTVWKRARRMVHSFLARAVHLSLTVTQVGLFHHVCWEMALDLNKTYFLGRSIAYRGGQFAHHGAHKLNRTRTSRIKAERTYASITHLPSPSLAFRMPWLGHGYALARSPLSPVSVTWCKYVPTSPPVRTRSCCLIHDHTESRCLSWAASTGEGNV